MTIIEANGISKTYQMGEVTINALDQVDFAVEEGQFVAVMGSSGSGKSTLLHLLGGLDRPTTGTIRLAGDSLSDLPDRKSTLTRRRKVGFVFQFYNLIPTMSAEENVALPLLLDGQRPRQYRQQVDRLLETVGLVDRRHHKPAQLSGGEQQRIAVARALITQPAVVLADEPTGNLDSKAGGEILQLLRRLCDEMGQTTVMVTHDPKAATCADKVVFLKDGRIADEITFDGQGDTADVLARLLALE